MQLTHELEKRKLITPPKWLANSVQYETIMGSVAYHVSNNNSDMDIYGFCIPPKEVIFPHLNGEIQGFGKHLKKFEQYQQHHIKREDNQKEYDIDIYNIVKYFQLCMDNNPNMIDSLYTPRECVLFCTEVGQMVRDNRDLFLHKGSWHRFRGYSYAQLHKMNNKNPEGKRLEVIEKYGFDTKYAVHLIRLLDEVEQILEHGTIDLTRAKEYLKAIRRGEVSKEEIVSYFNTKEKELGKLYHSSKLQAYPNESKIKGLLLKCLEHHYGSLDKCVIIESKAEEKLKRIQTILDE